MQNVVFRFRRSSGSRQQEPSAALTEALQRLGKAEEMPSLLAEARKSGRSVAIEIFHTSQSQPIFIHIKKEIA
jgi:hypothetical protein